MLRPAMAAIVALAAALLATSAVAQGFKPSVLKAEP